MDLWEGTQRAWTRQCPALRDLHPLDICIIMNIPSLQRRQERFRIITIWKSLEGIIVVQGGIKGEMREYKGRMCIVPPIKSREGSENSEKDPWEYKDHYCGIVSQCLWETMGDQGHHWTVSRGYWVANSNRSLTNQGTCQEGGCLTQLPVQAYIVTV